MTESDKLHTALGISDERSVVIGLFCEEAVNLFYDGGISTSQILTDIDSMCDDRGEKLLASFLIGIYMERGREIRRHSIFTN